MSKLSLRSHVCYALLAFVVGGLAVLSAACDDNAGGLALVTSPSGVATSSSGVATTVSTRGTPASAAVGSPAPSPATSTVIATSPSIVVTSPTVGRFQNTLTFVNPATAGSFNNGFGCTGVVLTPSLDLLITAGPLDLTMNTVSFRAIDGTNLFGPSVTVPTPQLNAQFGSTVVLANTSRAFALQPVFGCVTQPTLVTTTATFVDQRGARSTLTTTTVVR